MEDESNCSHASLVNRRQERPKFFFFSKKASRCLGITHIVLGTIVMLVQMSLLVLIFKEDKYFFNFQSWLAVSPGLWGGFGIVVVGIVAIIAGRKQSRAWIAVHNFLSILGFFIALVIVAISGYCIAVLFTTNGLHGPEYICTEWERRTTSADNPEWNQPPGVTKTANDPLEWSKPTYVPPWRQWLGTTERPEWNGLQRTTDDPKLEWWMRSTVQPENNGITTARWWDWLLNAKNTSEYEWRWWIVGRTTEKPITNSTSKPWRMIDLFTRKSTEVWNGDDMIWIDPFDDKSPSPSTTTESSIDNIDDYKNDYDNYDKVDDEGSSDGQGYDEPLSFTTTRTSITTTTTTTTTQRTPAATTSSSSSTKAPTTTTITKKFTDNGVDDEGGDDEEDYSGLDGIHDESNPKKPSRLDSEKPTEELIPMVKQGREELYRFPQAVVDEPDKVEDITLKARRKRQVPYFDGSSYEYICTEGYYDAESYDIYFKWWLVVVVHTCVMASIGLLEVLLTMISASQSCISLCCGPSTEDLYEYMKSSESPNAYNSYNTAPGSDQDCALLTDVLADNEQFSCILGVRNI